MPAFDSAMAYPDSSSSGGGSSSSKGGNPNSNNSNNNNTNSGGGSSLSKSCHSSGFLGHTLACRAPQMRSLDPPQVMDLPPLILPPPSEQGNQMPKSCPPKLHSPLAEVEHSFTLDARDSMDSIDGNNVQTVLSLLQSLEVAWMHDMEEDCDMQYYNMPNIGCFQLDDLQITAA